MFWSSVLGGIDSLGRRSILRPKGEDAAMPKIEPGIYFGIKRLSLEAHLAHLESVPGTSAGDGVRSLRWGGGSRLAVDAGYRRKGLSFKAGMFNRIKYFSRYMSPGARSVRRAAGFEPQQT